MAEDWSGVLRWGWRWVALVWVLAGVAFLFAYWVPPEEIEFLGFLANNDDNQLYLSFMREGARGAWLTTVRFTPEAHEPALLLPLYQVLGKVARTLHVSHELVFHLARLVGGVGLLGAAYDLGALCLPPGVARRSAFLLVCFSSGLGWLLVIGGLADRVLMPVDIRVPEASTFLTIFTSPHFVLGVTLELLTFLFFLRAGQRRGYLLAAAISLLLLALTLVYNVIVVAAVLVAFVLVRCVRERRLCPAWVGRLVAVGLPSVPVVAYYYLLLNYAPFWSIVYGEHDVVHSPGPLALLIGYGLVALLAGWGLVAWQRKRYWSPARELLAVWVIGNGLLLYVPLAFQGKLMAGWHAGMCVAAAAGLHEGLIPWARAQGWFRRWVARSPRAAATLRNVVLILAVPSTLLVALVGFRVALAERYFPYFLPTRDVAAVRWLAARTGEQDALLSSYGIGNYWVAHSEGRSFLGHQFAVLEPQVKDQALRRFYSGQAGELEQRRLLAEYGIDYVFYGTLERELGDGVEGVDFLEPVYRDGEVTIYGVRDVGQP